MFFRSRHLQANATLDDHLQTCDLEKAGQLSDLATPFEKVNKILFEAYQDMQGTIEAYYDQEKQEIEGLKQQNVRTLKVTEDVGKMTKVVSQGQRTTSVIGLIDTLTQHLHYLNRKEPARLEMKTNVLFTECRTKPSKDTFKDLLGTIHVSQDEITAESTAVSNVVPSPIKRARIHRELTAQFRLSISSDTKGCAPNGISCDSNANVYIVDEINRKVKVFSETGDLILTIQPEGDYKFIDPCDIAVIDKSTFAVSDRRRNRVLIIETEQGRVINCFEEMRSAWGLCYHSERGLFVADPKKRMVWLYSMNGRIRSRFKGPRDQEMTFPQWVAVNSNGDLLVTDFEGINAVICLFQDINILDLDHFLIS